MKTLEELENISKQMMEESKRSYFAMMNLLFVVGAKQANNLSSFINWKEVKVKWQKEHQKEMEAEKEEEQTREEEDANPHKRKVRGKNEK